MSHNIYEGDDALAVAAGIVIALLLTGAAGVTYLVIWKLGADGVWRPSVDAFWMPSGHAH